MHSLDIVMLSSIDWDFVWQRHQVFATLLSQWAPVFFVENTGFRSPRPRDFPRVVGRLRRWSGRRPTRLKNPVPENVKIISPIVLPPGRGLKRLINDWIFVPFLRRQLRAQGARANPVLWTYLPTFTTLSVIQSLKPSAVIYDCATNFYGHPEAPTYLEEVEKRLLDITNVILTDSPFLFRRFSRLHQPTVQLHHGVDFELFAQANQPSVTPKALCYFGSLHQHLDWEIIRGLALAGFEIVLIGPIVSSLPADLPANVSFHPPLSPRDLVTKIAPYPALLLPYHTHTDFMRGVIPAKIYECLATGKPVLSSPLPSYDDALRQILYLCASPTEFIKVAGSLDHLEHGKRQEQQLALAQQYSREATAQQLARVLSWVVGP